MRRKAYMIGIVAVGLIVTTLQSGPSYCRVVRSARDFHELFRSLDAAKADLNPLERLVFSLMLTTAGTTQKERGAA